MYPILLNCMRFINKHNFFLIFFMLCFTRNNCQLLTPYTFNMGGGYNENYLFDWSIGESASIKNFSTINNSLNTGLLQPDNRIIKKINENGPTVFGKQINIYPNPTSNFIRFKGNFTTTGTLYIQLIHANSRILMSYDAGIVTDNYETSFSLNQYPDDIFYIKVYFKPTLGNMKIGNYKVIKVSN